MVNQKPFLDNPDFITERQVKCWQNDEEQVRWIVNNFQSPSARELLNAMAMEQMKKEEEVKKKKEMKRIKF
jgi:hypothetical protein